MSYPDLRLPSDSNLCQSLARLPSKLLELGYREETLREMLDIRDLCQIAGEQLPAHMWHCQQDGTILALLAALFLLRQPVSASSFAHYVGEDETRALLACGVLEGDADALRAQVDLFPCLGRLVVTDHHLESDQQPGHVYELGADSYAIARVTPRHRIRRALDLCTGSGVQALLATFHAEEVVAVDVNPRALAYSRFNAALNGCSVDWRHSDLFEEVPQGSYELITANPPFVPSPDPSILIHRSPGESGEEVSRRLVAGLPRFLARGGLFSMVLDYPVMRDSTYLERLESWLGETLGWGIALLSFGTVTREHYIRQHLTYDGDFDAFQTLYDQYLASYDRLGIERVGFANVFILRLDKDVPNWTAHKETLVPQAVLADRVDDWLNDLVRVEDPGYEPDWETWKPRLSRNYATLWRDQGKARGLLESADLNWCPPMGLDRWQAMFASRLTGKKTAGELLEAWARSRRTDRESARADFLEQLRLLTRASAVE